MSYISTGINDSPVITDKAGATINNGAFKIVTRDANGKFIIPATVGVKATGVIIAATAAIVEANNDLTVQVKDIGYVVAGGAVKKGDLLTTNAQGQAVTVSASNYILGEALTEAVNAGDVIQIQITKSGFNPA